MVSSSGEGVAPWERCVGSLEPTSGSPNHPLLSISHILSTCQGNTIESLSCQPPCPASLPTLTSVVFTTLSLCPKN